ncbi:MAG: purine-binding chemotaxis protein CheW [Gammaproteobacteria bacterium]|nr:MAG: purine-binding chemotaxis protein CheW [Gammaproteobacteria bacterium]
MKSSSGGSRAYALLRSIESQVREHAAPLPIEVEVREDWVGIGFRVGDQRLLAPLGEVVEILTHPALSPVPGTRRWVRGIANVRGNLLPIMDLRGYLEGRPTPPGRRSRVLVIDHRGVYSGLVVDEVLGLRHFLPEERVASVEVPEAYRPYVEGGFLVGDESWGIFSLRRLAETPQFLHAAI